MTGLKAGLAIIIAVRETTQVPGPASSHLWKSITLVFHVKQARNPDGTKRYPGTLSVRHEWPGLRFAPSGLRHWANRPMFHVKHKQWNKR